MIKSNVREVEGGEEKGNLNGIFVYSIFLGLKWF